jgi:LemA protein
MDYNTSREIFPSNTVAGMFNFGEATLFEVENESERQTPKVTF